MITIDELCQDLLQSMCYREQRGITYEELRARVLAQRPPPLRRRHAPGQPKKKVDGVWRLIA